MKGMLELSRSVVSQIPRDYTQDLTGGFSQEDSRDKHFRWRAQSD